MADNSTHHRVYLPGPLTNRLPLVVDHPPGTCDTDDCHVVAALADWLASEPGPAIQVQGDYFTTDGLSFERCSWQPRRR